MKKNKFTVLELFILFSKPQRVGANRKMFGLRTNFSTKLRQDLSRNIEQRNMEEGTVNRRR